MNAKSRAADIAEQAARAAADDINVGGLRAAKGTVGGLSPAARATFFCRRGPHAQLVASYASGVPGATATLTACTPSMTTVGGTPSLSVTATVQLSVRPALPVPPCNTISPTAGRAHTWPAAGPSHGERLMSAPPPCRPSWGPGRRRRRPPAAIDDLGLLAVVLLAALTIGVPVALVALIGPAGTEVDAVDVRPHRAARRGDDPEGLVGHRVARVAAACLVRDRGDPGGRAQRGHAGQGAAVRRHPVRGAPAGDAALLLFSAAAALSPALSQAAPAAPGVQRLRAGPVPRSGTATRPWRGEADSGPGRRDRRPPRLRSSTRSRRRSSTW